MKESELHGAETRPVLTPVQQRLYGELIIRLLDTVLESGDITLLAEAVGHGIHCLNLAHIVLLKAPRAGNGVRRNQAGPAADRRAGRASP